MRDTFCSYCGTKYADASKYPRTCASCSVIVWANPIPVVVVLQPVVVGDRTGLLTIRRAIPPGIGQLALVGGFLEEHESWQQGGARELREETSVVIDPATLEPFWYASSAPKPNRLLLFATAPALRELPAWTPDHEASERGVVFGPGGLPDVFCFSTHIEAASRWFAMRGIISPHGFERA
jgi:ADP-ribose pyrophosphatase YjhB (NUDIX family)